TGRAGADGIAVSFCSREEHAMLRAIERVTKQKLLVGPRSEAFSDDEPTEEKRPAPRHRAASGGHARSQMPARSAVPKPKWRPKVGGRAKSV
ncbi:MAG: RNA helicase, partial [Patescibacteria group bacterium]|nr:RNA helicase [Patescibacteria group bacterium]